MTSPENAELVTKTYMNSKTFQEITLTHWQAKPVKINTDYSNLMNALSNSHSALVKTDYDFWNEMQEIEDESGLKEPSWDEQAAMECIADELGNDELKAVQNTSFVVSKKPSSNDPVMLSPHSLLSLRDKIKYLV
jgi:hypothetical protein